MPRTIIKTVYSFKEMLELEKEKKVTTKAVERVRNQLKEISTDGEWWDNTKDDMKTALDQVGFENADISFSGFGSQGDGASFTADINVAKLLWFMTNDIVPSEIIGPTPRTGDENDWLPFVVHKMYCKRHIRKAHEFDPKWKELEPIIDEISGRVVRDKRERYVHSRTCDLEIECGDVTMGQEQLVTQWEKAVEELRLNLCYMIYDGLEEEYFALNEDDALLELDEANEYSWDKDGAFVKA